MDLLVPAAAAAVGGLSQIKYREIRRRCQVGVDRLISYRSANEGDGNTNRREGRVATYGKYMYCCFRPCVFRS
jgi:hypothetical protein